MFQQLKGRPARADHGAAARLVRAPAPQPAAGSGRGGAAAAWRGGEADGGACGRGDAVVIRIHQVLATLGYGDAIGHEVLGIQRVLRAAGYESEIFVEARGPPARIDDARLSRAHRLQPSRQSAPASLLARVQSVAHGVCPARPDGAHLPQHHAAGVFCRPAPFPDQRVFPRAAGARGRTPIGAISRSATPSSTDRISRRSGSRGPPSCRSCRISRILTWSPIARSPTCTTTPGPTSCSSAGSCRARSSKTSSASFTRITRSTTRARGCSWSALRADSTATWRRSTSSSATLGDRHVHFVGQVSNEELAAFYEIADLFLCASEHEGFCVPLVEAFYKQIPVLAYAATAVPATMDGAGVLYTDKDPSHVAALMDAVVSNSDVQEAVIRGQLAAVDRLRARDFAGTLLGFVRQDSLRPAGTGVARHVRLLASVRRRRRARGAASRSAVDLQGPAAAMIVNQWLAAAHRGDAIGDSARRFRDLLRGLGHESELFALTIDEDLEDEVRPFSDPAARRGDITVLHYALAVADDGSLRVARSRSRSPLSQRDAGRLFRAVRCGAVPARGAGAPGSRNARRARRSGARGFGVQPPGARGARLCSNRGAADCGRHGPNHPARPPRRRSSGCWTTSW